MKFESTLKLNQGFTMIELLVSIIVLAIGLIGFAALQAAGLKSNNTALVRTHANILVTDMIDRIRINPNGNYSIGKTAAPPSTSLACEDGGANCSSADIANYDLAQWKCGIGSYDEESVCQMLNITGALPEGKASITVAGNIYTIAVEWTESVHKEVSESGDGKQIVTFSMTTQI